jgi:hypothetical protein
VVVLVAPRRTSSVYSRSKTGAPFNEPLSLSSAAINGSAAHSIAIVAGIEPSAAASFAVTTAAQLGNATNACSRCGRLS